MDRVDEYRRIVMELLQEYHQNRYQQVDLEQDVIFDTERDHYQLIVIGWQGKRRLCYPIIHIDLKDDKVWLQQDSTDAEIANELVARGIPKSQIVLGFHPERIRPHTGFAIH